MRKASTAKLGFSPREGGCRQFIFPHHFERLVNGFTASQKHCTLTLCRSQTATGFSCSCFLFRFSSPTLRTMLSGNDKNRAETAAVCPAISAPLIRISSISCFGTINPTFRIYDPTEPTQIPRAGAIPAPMPIRITSIITPITTPTSTPNDTP